MAACFFICFHPDGAVFASQDLNIIKEEVSQSFAFVVTKNQSGCCMKITSAQILQFVHISVYLLELLSQHKTERTQMGREITWEPHLFT